MRYLGRAPGRLALPVAPMGVNWFGTLEFPKSSDGHHWDSAPHAPVTSVCLLGAGHVEPAVPR